MTCNRKPNGKIGVRNPLKMALAGLSALRLLMPDHGALTACLFVVDATPTTFSIAIRRFSWPKVNFPKFLAWIPTSIRIEPRLRALGFPPSPFT